MDAERQVLFIANPRNYSTTPYQPPPPPVKISQGQPNGAPRSFPELEIPRIPRRRSVIQAGKNIFHPGPFVAVSQPAQLNYPPQFVAESKSRRPLWFLRSEPHHNLGESHNIPLELDVGVVSA